MSTCAACGSSSPVGVWIYSNGLNYCSNACHRLGTSYPGVPPAPTPFKSANTCVVCNALLPPSLPNFCSVACLQAYNGHHSVTQAAPPNPKPTTVQSAATVKTCACCKQTMDTAVYGGPGTVHTSGSWICDPCFYSVNCAPSGCGQGPAHALKASTSLNNPAPVPAPSPTPAQSANAKQNAAARMLMAQALMNPALISTPAQFNAVIETGELPNERVFKPKCECGAAACRSAIHSDYCPAFEERFK